MKATALPRSNVPSFPRYCWFFIIGYVLAPMTSWRVWKVGPGEIFCLLGCISYLGDRYKAISSIGSLKIRSNYMNEFWIEFLLTALFGCLWCTIAYPEESSPVQLLTWIYLAIVSLVSFNAFRDIKELDSLILFTCSIATIWYILLYIYGEMIDTHFVGANLWYGYKAHFTGGANNPHQLALPMAVNALVLATEAFKKQLRIPSKILCLVLSIMSVWILWETDSSTGKMALAVGFVLSILSSIEDGEVRLLVIFVALTVSVLCSDELISAFMRWVSSDSNGQGRLEIFSTFPQAFTKGPVFGLGPGNHAYEGAMEFHNTYLEVLSMSGLFGGLIFLIFTLQILRRIRNNTISAAIVFALYAFGFSGFAFRRLTYWLLLSFAINIADKTCKVPD